MKTCPDCNGDGVVGKDTDDEQQCSSAVVTVLYLTTTTRKTYLTQRRLIPEWCSAPQVLEPLRCQLGVASASRFDSAMSVNGT